MYMLAIEWWMCERANWPCQMCATFQWYNKLLQTSCNASRSCFQVSCLRLRLYPQVHHSILKGINRRLNINLAQHLTQHLSCNFTSRL